MNYNFSKIIPNLASKIGYNMKTMHIKIILSVALIAIIGLQLLWLYNMYRLNRNLKSEQILQTLTISINKELSNRREMMQIPFSWKISPFNKKDSLETKHVQVITEDATYMSKNEDLYNENTLTQLALKSYMPINIHNLDSIFRKALLESGIPVKKTYIEYYDKDKNTPLLTKNPIAEWTTQSFETPLLYVDLLNSTGVKAYINIPFSDVLKEMFFQLIL